MEINKKVQQKQLLTKQFQDRLRRSQFCQEHFQENILALLSSFWIEFWMNIESNLVQLAGGFVHQSGYSYS